MILNLIANGQLNVNNTIIVNIVNNNYAMEKKVGILSKLQTA